MHRILLTGAFEGEIDLLQSKLHKKSLSQTISNDLYPSLFPKGTNKICFDIYKLGIGPITSALSLQKILLEKKNLSTLEIIFLGSAGIFPKNQKVNGQCLFGPGCYASSQNFFFHDWNSLSGKGKQPTNMLTHCYTKLGNFSLYIREKLKTHSKIKNFYQDLYTNTPPSITIMDISPKDIQKQAIHFQLENLETFGLAQLASDYNIPFTAFLAITNDICSEASSLWNKNYRLMSSDLQLALLSCI